MAIKDESELMSFLSQTKDQAPKAASRVASHEFTADTSSYRERSVGILFAVFIVMIPIVALLTLRSGYSEADQKK